MTRSTDTATLRSLAQAAGLTGVIVRKGTGCRRGAIHFFMASGSTREQREAAAAFLVAHEAIVVFGCPVETSKRPDVLRFFDSTTVLSFAP